MLGINKEKLEMLHYLFFKTKQNYINYQFSKP